MTSSYWWSTLEIAIYMSITKKRGHAELFFRNKTRVKQFHAMYKQNCVYITKSVKNCLSERKYSALMGCQPKHEGSTLGCGKQINKYVHVCYARCICLCRAGNTTQAMCYLGYWFCIIAEDPDLVFQMHSGIICEVRTRVLMQAP